MPKPQAGSNALITERTGGSHRLRSGTLVPTPCQPLSGRAEATGCDSGTLVPTPARRVSSALPELFTRGLPPCGSCVAEATGCVSHPRAHSCPPRQQRVARALYPRATALRLIALPYGGSSPSHFSLLTSHFSLLTSHFSLLTSHFSLLTSVALPSHSGISIASQLPLPAGCRQAAHRVPSLFTSVTLRSRATSAHQPRNAPPAAP
jgi:hypothetical protein